MNRRMLILSIPAVFALPSLAFSQEDPLSTAFAALSLKERKEVQNEAAIGGFYNGAIDGAYGPKTRMALLDTAQFITHNSRAKIVLDVTTSAGATDFLARLARRELSAYLYGEGDETE